MRLAIALGALALGPVGVSVTTLPRPAFPGPVAHSLGHQLVLVSSNAAPRQTTFSAKTGTPFKGLPLQAVISTANRLFLTYGPDGSTARYLVALTKTGKELYAFDFANYGWPPRFRAGDREFVYEQPVWARESNGTLYVENAHPTYASSSYNQNAYITAIDLKTRRAIWRSPALVANANTFLVTPHYLITGYGFTDEPDFLHLLDRKTGREVDSLPVPTAPERITWQGSLIHVRTYDHDLLVRLSAE